jgi:uncharacterized protein
MKIRTILSFLLIFAIVFGLNGYIGWHGQVFLSNQLGVSFHSGWYWLVFWVVALSYLLAWAGSKVLPADISRILKIIGSYWFAIMQFGFLLLPLTDLAAGVLYLASVSPQTFIPILGWVDAAIVVILMLWGSYNARSPILRKYEITVPKKAGDWKHA